MNKNLRPARKKMFSRLGIVFFVLFFIAGLFSVLSENEEFVVSVNPQTKELLESKKEESFFIETFNFIIRDTKEYLADNSLFILAAVNPSQTAISFSPGMRREEIVSILANRLSWDESDEKDFSNVNTFLKTKSIEGFYYPGTYLVSPDMGGDEIANMMLGRFSKKIISLYGTSTQEIIDLDTAVKIASIIEREAGGKNDMRLISGIIWNRLFSDMSLDIDATLQYAKGTEKNWWPKVNPEDKFIDSPFNTYQNKGLTPTAIANPSKTSIEAALNPKKTDCLFYLHDKYRRIHCSATYKGHEKNIRRYYGVN